jgi:hypothetical protein
MKAVIILIIYYLYLTAIVFGTGYIVFYKGESGWWFLLTLILSQITPTMETKKED